MLAKPFKAVRELPTQFDAQIPDGKDQLTTAPFGERFLYLRTAAPTLLPNAIAMSGRHGRSQTAQSILAATRFLNVYKATLFP